MNDQFIKHFLEAVRADRGEGFYAVGEYWKNDTESLEAYLSQVEYNVDLFDVALHYNLNEASEKGRDYDLRDLLKGTLVEICPDQAVTFVDNHDSQKNSSLESQVKDWFKPSAYGLILLMKKGYPCIFYGDYYGVKGKKSPHRKVLDMLLRARKEYAYGEEVDYLIIRTRSASYAWEIRDMLIRAWRWLSRTGKMERKQCLWGRTGKARYGMRSQAR